MDGLYFGTHGSGFHLHDLEEDAVPRLWPWWYTSIACFKDQNKSVASLRQHYDLMKINDSGISPPWNQRLLQASWWWQSTCDGLWADSFSGLVWYVSRSHCVRWVDLGELLAHTPCGPLGCEPAGLHMLQPLIVCHQWYCERLAQTHNRALSLVITALDLPPQVQPLTNQRESINHLNYKIHLRLNLCCWSTSPSITATSSKISLVFFLPSFVYLDMLSPLMYPAASQFFSVVAMDCQCIPNKT